MKKYVLPLIFLFLILFSNSCSQKDDTTSRTIPLELLKDKIAGGWAGKMIGVTYGAPSEFRAQGLTYEDTIRWKPSDVKGAIWQDDIYVQLTFLMTMDQFGMDAPGIKFQENLAKAGYPLWHANVQARKNYFDSIFAPQSGHPDYNLHADDIDFQIESDYIGFMCPGMPQSAVRLAEKPGHVMNYGDGYYGGVFVAALYAEAYFENDIPKIIEKALLSIPAESDYAKLIRDVMILHQEYPDDWRSAWKDLEAKWGSEHVCAPGTSFNIDAKVNGAYIVMGLLYGNGDFLKTMEVATRCGQDSDCNPSNAMAVLGVINGFSQFPEEWQEAVRAIGDSLFIHTNYTFNKAVEKTAEYACSLVLAGGGKVTGKTITLNLEQPQAPPLEISFPKVVFDHRVSVFDTSGGWKKKGNWTNYIRSKRNTTPQALCSDTPGDELVFTFNGTGVSLNGNWLRNGGKADIFVDGEFKRTIDCYFNYAGQEHLNMDLYHLSGLPSGSHTLRVVVKGEKRPGSEGALVYITEGVIFKTEDKVSEKTTYTFLQ
ncbi:MAG TPA: ADP-ribosylglycohydrolase family protein [Prolixibacteraceae bacterium]|nr:ADP-ribosylglycohydrolase family protein [Prolixibacteraceae bacterium]